MNAPKNRKAARIVPAPGRHGVPDGWIIEPKPDHRTRRRPVEVVDASDADIPPPEHANGKEQNE